VSALLFIVAHHDSSSWMDALRAGEKYSVLLGLAFFVVATVFRMLGCFVGTVVVVSVVFAFFVGRASSSSSNASRALLLRDDR